MKTGYLEEGPGIKSNIRLMSLIVLIYTLVFIHWHVIVNRQPIDSNFIMLVLIMLTAAFVPKVLQKYSEMRIEAPGVRKPNIDKTTTPPTGE